MIDHEFEEWLSFMDDKIEELLEELPRKVRTQLDYSPKSLAVLEEWLLSTYATPEEIKNEENKHFLDRIGCYVGECFRKKLGGKWEINNTDPADVFYGLPVVRGKRIPEFCPLCMVTASIDRRTGVFLKSILEANLP